MGFAEKRIYAGKRDIVIEEDCDSDIASDAIVISHRKKWIGDINGGTYIVICDCTIASESFPSGHKQMG